MAGPQAHSLSAREHIVLRFRNRFWSEPPEKFVYYSLLDIPTLLNIPYKKIYQVNYDDNCSSLTYHKPHTRTSINRRCNFANSLTELSWQSAPPEWCFLFDYEPKYLTNLVQSVIASTMMWTFVDVEASGHTWMSVLKAHYWLRRFFYCFVSAGAEVRRQTFWLHAFGFIC